MSVGNWQLWAGLLEKLESIKQVRMDPSLHTTPYTMQVCIFTGFVSCVQVCGVDFGQQMVTETVSETAVLPVIIAMIFLVSDKNPTKMGNKNITCMHKQKC